MLPLDETIEPIFAEVVRRNVSEIEFQQAVREVLERPHDNWPLKRILDVLYRNSSIPVPSGNSRKWTV